jgi:hypothetical protein
VTVPTRGGRGRRRGITAHRCRLDPRDRTVRDGIPVTSIPRTLLDLAEILKPAQLQRSYERAERLRVLDVAAIHELLGRSNGRRGVAALRDVLAYDPSRAAEASSELELRFLDLLRAAGLPLPQVNVLVEGFLVDAYWSSARLVVELQGYAYHSDRTTFERDHTRIAQLRLAGFEVLALTHRQVSEEPSGCSRPGATVEQGGDCRPDPREHDRSAAGAGSVPAARIRAATAKAGVARSGRCPIGVRPPLAVAPAEEGRHAPNR